MIGKLGEVAVAELAKQTHGLSLNVDFGVRKTGTFTFDIDFGVRNHVKTCSYKTRETIGGSWLVARSDPVLTKHDDVVILVYAGQEPDGQYSAEIVGGVMAGDLQGKLDLPRSPTVRHKLAFWHKDIQNQIFDFRKVSFQ